MALVTFDTPVKFLGTETRSGQKDGKDWTMLEAIFSVPDVGKIKVMCKGKPKFPAINEVIELALSVDQGRFQSMLMTFDEQSIYQSMKKAA